MKNIRVCIVYLPWLYTDIFQHIFQKMGRVTIIENFLPDFYPRIKKKQSWNKADIIILSLDSHGIPDMNLLPRRMPKALLIAFSPYGDYGLSRRPGENHWKVIKPFGFEQLIQMVHNEGREAALAQTTPREFV